MILEYLLHVNPEDHMAMRFLGECRRRLHGPRDRQALELFRRAVELDSRFPPYCANYGHAAIAAGDQETKELKK